jgi:hypothetical protein
MAAVGGGLTGGERKREEAPKGAVHHLQGFTNGNKTETRKDALGHLDSLFSVGETS